MTAEIAVLNKMAIALAADSAVTIERLKGQKIYNTANKLFALSKFHPIGIMFYGNAEFMGIPWESLIKIYRTKIGNQKFDTLAHYADNFIKFLKTTPLFPQKEQEKYLIYIVRSYFHFIKTSIDENINQEIESKTEIDENKVKKVVSETIKNHRIRLNGLNDLAGIKKNQSKKLAIKYKTLTRKIIKDVFQELPLINSSLNDLTWIMGFLFTKDIFPAAVSGVVIAGFGECDTFPSIKSFSIETKIDNKLKYKEENWEQISFSNSAAIIPFAQSEMVSTFMEGIDPNLKQIYETYLKKLFSEYPDYVIENINQLNDSEKKGMKKKLSVVGDKVLEDLKKKIRNNIFETHIIPIISAVSVLPKDELAAMAEALVNLTSFKRKVSMDAETVGGPIDVAVISKGDGFVWIKRKHYFKSDINPQFFLKYFLDTKSEDKNEEKYC